MDKFVASLNIEHLRKQIMEEPNDTKRAVLSTILAEEEAKLVVIMASRRDAKSV